MKKYILPILVVVAFGIYVLLNSQKSIQVGTSSSATTTASDPGNMTPTVAQNPASGGTSSPVSVPAPTSVPTPVLPTGKYKDGTYKGSVADAYFGNLQTVAIISGGKIVDVQYPIYPNDNGYSQRVSRTSLPTLKQEAIKSQSANVNIVSGATQTSQAFQESLGAALAIAKN